MFTDRFLKVPIKVYDIKHKEITGEEILTDNYLKFNPFELCSYKPTLDEAEDSVHVKLKNGDCFYVYLNITEFETLLNKHNA